MRHAVQARWLAGLLLVAAAMQPLRAAAQSPTPSTNVQSPVTGKELEITVGAVFLTPVSMGEQEIALIAPSGSPLPIATTTSRTNASYGLEARLGFRASRRVRFEVAGGWSRVGFQTEVSSDSDLDAGTAAGSATASLPINRFAAGGAVTFSLSQKGKRELYVIGGASWMRELSEISAVGVYDDGAIVDGGGGMKLWWRERSTGHIKRLGLRVEGRVGVRTGGLSLDDKSSHIVSTVIGSLIIGS